MDTSTTRPSAPSFGIFTDWAIQSSAHYVSTTVLLFALGLLARFLGAFKAQLERRWSSSTDAPNRYTRHKEHVHFPADESEEFHPLKPETPTALEEPRGPPEGGFWIADGRWNGGREGIRAGVEFARAVIAYFLMLAVMTYDVGFFLAVTASVLVGEFVFGRYERGARG